MRRGSLGLAGDALTLLAPHPRVPSPGPWVQTRSPVMPAQQLPPTSRSWPSSPCRRSVDFVKQVPGFLQLGREDQIAPEGLYH